MQILSNTKAQNGYAILSFENPYWVWFLIHESVVTLSWIGISSSAQLKAKTKERTARYPGSTLF